MQDSGPLEEVMPRLSYADLAGYLVIYLVPGLDGSTTNGKRLCNCAAYLPIVEQALPEVMVDYQGESHVDFSTADSDANEAWWRSTIGSENRFTYEGKP